MSTTETVEHENSTEEITQNNSLEESDTRNNTRTVAGVLFIIFGLYFLLDNLNVLNIHVGRIIVTWWPLLFVYLGIEQLAKNKPAVRTLWYIILIAVVAYILMSGIFN